jgi:hypothetical protein
MGTRHQTIAAISLIVPALLGAQIKPTVTSTTTNLALLKPVLRTDMLALSGSSLSTVTTYFDKGCDTGGCTVVKATTAPGVSIPLGGSSVPATQLRATLLTPHGIDHTLYVVVNGSEILNALCNSAMELKLLPNFKAMGATTNAFSWQVFEGGKLTKNGQSIGDAFTLNLGGPVSMANLYDFTVTSHGTIEILHGTLRIVLTPQNSSGIGAKTGGSLKFEDLGLRVAGVDQFAIVSAGLK